MRVEREVHVLVGKYADGSGFSVLGVYETKEAAERDKNLCEFAQSVMNLSIEKTYYCG